MDLRGSTCDPCGYQGKHSKAKTFCETCKEYYCKHCTKQHLKFRISMNHRLVRDIKKCDRVPARKGIVNAVFETSELCSTMEYLCPRETSYKLHILETEAAKRCKLSGCCRFTIHRTGIMLTDTAHPEVTYEWPYTCIRKVGSMENKLFYFESGRRCCSGEGRFVLMTHDAALLHSLVMKSIKSIQTKNTK